MSPSAVVSVPARAGLAGGPSDLYGGAVFTVPVPAFSATVEVVDAASNIVTGDPDGRALVNAALARVPDAAPCEVRWTSDIPRAVGLAGSSAIVVATLRALHRRIGRSIDELDLALLAMSVEADDLGIVAGLQDRAVQAAGRPVLVDVSGEVAVVTPVDPGCPIDLLVAWLSSAAGDSGDYHRALRARLRADPDVAAMNDLADLAREAAGAFEAGDTTRLAECMANSAAIRNRVAPMGPDHERLAAAVTNAGLRPNSAGSGGAVVAVADDPETVARAVAAVESIGGGHVHLAVPVCEG